MAALPLTPLAIGAACFIGLCRRSSKPRSLTQQASPCEEPSVSDKVRERIANTVAGGDRVCRASAGGPCIETGVTARRVFAGKSRVCRM